MTGVKRARVFTDHKHEPDQELSYKAYTCGELARWRALDAQ